MVFFVSYMPVGDSHANAFLYTWRAFASEVVLRRDLWNTHSIHRHTGLSPLNEMTHIH